MLPSPSTFEVAPELVTFVTMPGFAFVCSWHAPRSERQARSAEGRALKAGSLETENKADNMLIFNILHLTATSEDLAQIQTHLPHAIR